LAVPDEAGPAPGCRADAGFVLDPEVLLAFL